MIIKALVENTSKIKDLGIEHGLSLYMETSKHKLLFDTGASALFAENALKLNVYLKEVDLAVISHGHYDHGGGLKTFLSINSKAKIYINNKAFQKYYSHRANGENAYIGLDEALMTSERFVFVGDYFSIDEELELFSDVKGRRCSPSGNQNLFKKVGESFLPDDFAHEQNLIIKESNKTVLLAGCAHNGIINILEHFKAKYNFLPSHVIGGFHLYNRTSNKSEDPAVVAEIGAYLLNTGAKYYTCHCTGIESYNRLKDIMGEKLDYISTGTQLVI